MPLSATPVLLVEDSPIALTILQRLLSSSSEVKVVGTAYNGREALELIPRVQPAVICTDLYMKEMDGLEFTKQVMAKYPRPILVISTGVRQEDTHNTFQLLAAGAVDVFPKPKTGLLSDYEQVRQELINKIKILAGVTVFTRPQFSFTTKEKQFFLQPSTPNQRLIDSTPIEAIAIGASTGGPQAFHTILSQLPVDLPVPVICVQHIAHGFLEGLVNWLALECRLEVKIATVGEFPLPGKIYFAPERSHLELDARGRFAYSISPPVDGHRPSVTTTFKSIANFYGKATAAVLLTGMGRDGAEGMQAIEQVGGVTIAQDKESSVVFGMPREAIALGAVQYIRPIQEIVPLLLTKIFKNNR